MTCTEREPELLLHLHGALSPGRQMLTILHLRRCSRCRAQQRRWQSVSGQAADAIRGPLRPLWSPRHAYPAIYSALSAILLASALLLSVSLSLIVVNRHRSLPLGGSSSPNRLAFPGGCRPDLPNDHCR